MAREKTIGIALNEEEYREVMAFLLARSLKEGKRLTASVYARELLLGSINGKDAKQNNKPIEELPDKMDTSKDAKQDTEPNMFKDIIV